MAYKISVKHTQNSRLASVDFNNIPFGRTMSDHMFVADYINGEWTNMEICPLSNFSVSPANNAWHYGQSIFEGMKASKMMDGTPALFRAEKHAQRLNASARRMCMPEVPEALFLQALEMLLDVDRDWIPPMEGSTLYIRPFMFAMDDVLSVHVSNTYKFCIITGPVGPYYARPVTLWAEPFYIRAAHGGTGEAKAAGNYGGAYLPTKLAQEKGYDQILWLDAVEHKYVQEVGTMNIMFVIDGKVVTANCDGTILRGITRDCIIILLRDNGYTVEERPLSMDELWDAYQAGKLTEIFGCGTAAVVNMVSAVTWGDKKIELDPSKSVIAEFAKTQINKMRTGEVADVYGWVQPLEIGELV
jgi:branched-chain amino acid aminotransferase